MSTEPEFLLPDPDLQPAPVSGDEATFVPFPPRIRHIPNIGHTLVFALMFVIVLALTQWLEVVIVLGKHALSQPSVTEVARDPRFAVPSMVVAYFAIGVIAVILFRAWWCRPFAEGVRWDLAPLRRHPWLLVGTGIVVSIAVQLLSNFLPIPKELPIDDFFRTPLDVWMVAIFGVFVAPVFEELAFRGFLLPSLATSWDWITGKWKAPEVLDLTVYAPPLQLITPLQDPLQDPLRDQLREQLPKQLKDQKWSRAALIFASTITSICFALLHSDQLAHAYAPLGVLFCVSLVLCFVRLRYHSIAASALVHACYNGAIFALLFIATSGFRHLDKLKQ